MTEWSEYPLALTGQPGQISLRVANVRSTQLRNSRDLVVALPPGYRSTGVSYPVVYLQDGQNLFDPATSFAGDWGLRETLSTLAPEGVEAILVGIPNRGSRRRYEYSPFRDIIHGGGGGDRYLAFLVETVKPLIDASFRTRPDRSHTVIAGASLGGLISLYALYRHAGVFGAAGVQSPALWFADRAIFQVFEAYQGPPPGRIYLDVGSEEGAGTLRNVRELRDRLVAAGYLPGRDLSYVEEEGGQHDERAWGRRFGAALPFLLGTPASGDP